MSKRKKLRWIVENFFKDPENVMRELMSHWHQNEEQQRVLDGFSENTISNYVLPFGVAPNFLINDKTYVMPMVIEESSVVAAASSAAKFWMARGGFKAKVIATKKVGQVHFSWSGNVEKLNSVFEELEAQLRIDVSHITANMENRGGGILDISLLDMTHLEDNYFQLKVNFETCDSMGANFINSVLEEFGRSLKNFVAKQEKCGDLDAMTFAEKFCKAIRIAHIDPHRATTHNKGIFNGIDAVVLATANDFRAVESCGHTYAARDGQYRSLSYCSIENGVFKFWLDLPIALGTVGGLTKLHPVARRSLELLGNPSASELMEIIAVAGLAQNFAAVKSLVTTGIQKGHMKMHLFSAVRDFLALIRGEKKKDISLLTDQKASS